MQRYTFGQLLRKRRRNCLDPEKDGRLTQERLMDLLSLEANQVYSNQTASNWERGKSKPRIDERHIQVGLVKVLHNCGSIHTPDDANELLRAGNYRLLDEEEQRSVFPDWKDDDVGSADDPLTVANVRAEVPRPSPRQLVYEAILDIIYNPGDVREQMLKGRDAAPRWPYLFERVLTRPLQGATPQKVLIIVFWLGLWMMSWLLVFPLLRWPFDSQAKAWAAAALFAAGSLAVPLATGTLAYTSAVHELWHERHVASHARRTAYLGAFAGFHLGYSLALVIMLLGYYAGAFLPSWLQFVLAGLPVLLGYILANELPFHYWFAFGSPMKFTAGDTAVFLILGLYGLLLGFAVSFIHQWLLIPEIGIPLILAGIGLVALLHVLEGRLGPGLLPTAFVALFALLFLLTQQQSLVTASTLTSLSVAVGTAVWYRTVKTGPLITLTLLSLALVGGWFFSTGMNAAGWGILAVLVATAAWGWQRGSFRLPVSLVAIIVLSIMAQILAGRGAVEETYASIGLILATAAFLWLEFRQYQ